MSLHPPPSIQRRRRIIVCMDGTWETPAGKSNVYKFFSSIDDTFNAEEFEYKIEYYSGLGTGKFFILTGGAFGVGITQQIISAYKYICQNYRDENDEIWLLGFSRGAYTARSLSGLIYNVGLLSEANLSHAEEAYDIYRDRSEDTRPGQSRSVAFHKQYDTQVPMIDFLGCFDTVGSLGVPKLPWYLGGSTFYSLFFGLHGFHDTKLTPIVKNAYHAMSLHDQRAWFSPTMMNFSSAVPDHQTLEQVWFPGVHGDIGGQDKGPHDNLLSCHSLNWMKEKAMKNGLRFKTSTVDCNRSSQFIYQDSYGSNIVYSIMPRQDRIIPVDEVKKEYVISQLYLNGHFEEYMTAEQLAMYKSKTLDTFYKNIQIQKELEEQ